VVVVAAVVAKQLHRIHHIARGRHRLQPTRQRIGDKNQAFGEFAIGCDAHGYGKRFIVYADEKLTAFVESESVIPKA
jgi:hypothetical protein